MPNRSNNLLNEVRSIIAARIYLATENPKSFPVDDFEFEEFIEEKASEFNSAVSISDKELYFTPEGYLYEIATRYATLNNDKLRQAMRPDGMQKDQSLRDSIKILEDERSQESGRLSVVPEDEDDYLAERIQFEIRNVFNKNPCDYGISSDYFKVLARYARLRAEFNSLANFGTNTIESMMTQQSKQVKDIAQMAYDSSLSAPPRKSGGCFVATVCFGSEVDPTVKILRGFRDNTLLNYWSGKKFISWYYRNGPGIAQWVIKHHTLKIISRFLLLGIAKAVQPWSHRKKP